MKAGFVLTNPMVIGVDWSFVPEISRETAVEEEGTGAVEEGEVIRAVRGSQEVVEVTGAAREPEEIVVIDEPELTEIPEQSSAAVSDVPTSDSILPGQLD